MASCTAVGHNTTLALDAKGETVRVALAGTYSMVIKLQVEQGAKGSGAYLTVKQFSTVNATVAYDHVTQSPGEQLRLIVTTDTSGTCTATLTETSNLSMKTFKDRLGTSLMTLTQKFTKIHGGLVRDTGAVVNTTVALVLNEGDHAGRIVTANHATGFAITLPEATATGNVYTIFYGTTVGAGNATIVAPSGDTSFIGGVGLSTDIAGVTILANAADDTITMNGSTKGGIKGTFLRFTDVASGIFMVEGFLCASGTEADPFSAGV